MWVRTVEAEEATPMGVMWCGMSGESIGISGGVVEVVKMRVEVSQDFKPHLAYIAHDCNQWFQLAQEVPQPPNIQFPLDDNEKPSYN